MVPACLPSQFNLETAMLSIFLSHGDAAPGRPTRQGATHTLGCFEVHGTKKRNSEPQGIGDDLRRQV